MTDEDVPQRTGKTLKRAKQAVESVHTEGEIDKKARESLDEQNVLDRQSSRNMRENYAGAVFKYLSWYTAGAAVFVFLHGWQKLGFHLEPPILAVIVGSTAVSAIGLVGIVVKGLFK